ncbi:hypothetical protein K3727_15650 [Rhodobacteraceae bacterium M382]|nr:hypothetical protein K3727_15650 [Rhodobacteraceae bacterium M382]
MRVFALVGVIVVSCSTGAQADQICHSSGEFVDVALWGTAESAAIHLRVDRDYLDPRFARKSGGTRTGGVTAPASNRI